MTGYLLVGVVVAVIMGRGIVLARRTKEAMSAYAVTGVAVLVSVALWVVLSDPLELPDSTPAVVAIGVEIIALAAVAVRLRGTARPPSLE